MKKAQLETLESEINAELYARTAAGHEIHEPITDGVVDIDRYLASSPKLLWLLKEPWEKPADGEVSEGWSITEFLRGDGSVGNKGTWARLAYASYAVFHDCPEYSQIPFVTECSQVRDALRQIAYVNVKKYPGKTRSNPSEITRYYSRYRALLIRQIETISPDVIIAGNILHLLYEDFGLSRQDLISEGSLEFCLKDGRLYINAYHPGNWCCSPESYVKDLHAVIRMHFS